MTINFMPGQMLYLRPTPYQNLVNLPTQGNRQRASILSIFVNCTAQVVAVGNIAFKNVTQSYIQLIPLISGGTTSNLGQPNIYSPAYNNGTGVTVYFDSDDDLNSGRFSIRVGPSYDVGKVDIIVYSAFLMPLTIRIKFYSQI